MNTPDDSTIQNWLKGELEGNELKKVEAWAEENAEELEAKMGWESIASGISAAIPSQQDPPYATFFNDRVKHHAIESIEPEAEPKAASFWNKFNWIFAPTAIAGMALCFYLGTRVDQDPVRSPLVTTLDAVYTPVAGVDSEVIISDDSTVIVLDGLEEIPESLDIVSGETGMGISPRMLVKAQRGTYYF